MTAVEKIAVIGFGSAGAAAAIALKRAGFAVEVFERAEKIGPVGAGILLHPSGQLVLDRLGILEAVTSCSEPIGRIRAETTAGKPIIDIRYDEQCPGRTAYGVERTNLFRALERAAVDAGVRFHLGTEITKLEQAPDGVILRLKSGEHTDRFHAALICDGARSALRAIIAPRSRCFCYRYGARWTIGSCTAVRGKLYQVVQGTKHLVGVLPTGNGRASFFWGTAPDERREDFATWRDSVLSICPPAEELLAPLTGFNDLIETKYLHLFPGPSTVSRAVLLGDARHAMSPHLGQGTNLALLDGYVFGRSLAAADGKFEPALADFAGQRNGNNRVYATMSFCFSPFFQSGGRCKGILRDTFLPQIGRVPWLRRQMVHSISGLKRSFLGFDELELKIP